MFPWGGHSQKFKVSLGCIVLLGVTAGAGIANMEMNGNRLSSFLGTIVDSFKGQSSSSITSSKKFDPITPIFEVSSWIWNVALGKAFNFVATSYEWIQKDDNFQTITSFLKNFWDYEMLKQFLFNLPWTIWAWINVLKEKNMLLKFPLAIKRSSTLATAFFMKVKDQAEDLKMINWLYLRILVNPRKTLNILSRAQIESKLICNGKKPKGPKGGSASWLGNCFFQNGKLGGKTIKLKSEIEQFLKTGENLKDKSRQGVKK